KSSEINTIQITDQILLDPAQMGILENSGIAMNIINPFDSELSISFEEPLTGNVSLTDINGRILIETVFNDESEIQLNTMNVSSGTYFLNIESNGKIITRKLIK
ncbi:MAG: T9SS type A sorting domain-containing protein, partial [Crocinitomicaceae bacterium]|nr:T9SS type A sorting domain-containing protein [Crocinitomicaceae bacterium]